jgi:CubicO group peptidase (beta-lactamase class C family)
LLAGDGKLDIDRTVGELAAAVSCWSTATIRSLRNMTSGIPNYSEAVEVGQIVAADLNHQFTPSELIGAVDPDNGKHLPPNSGWFYSNTNYILASLILRPRQSDYRGCIGYVLQGCARNYDSKTASTAPDVLFGRVLIAKA